MATKAELIKKLRGRKVKLVGGKWVAADRGFDFNNWTKAEVEQHLRGSKRG